MCSTADRRLVRQAFRFELDPNWAQRVLLTKSVGASRFIYNWGLAESQRAYEATGKRPKLSELKTRLVELKRGECPWLYEVSAHIGQQALVDLDRAFERFFAGLKAEGPRSGFPRFKKKGERDSARLYGMTLEERHLRLPNIGRVRLKERASERGFEGRILSATISRRADRWFCSLAVEREREIVQARPVTHDSDVVGVDLGLKRAAVIRLHYRIWCQRNDFLHQLSGQLARTKPVIVLEDLNVKGMARNRSLSLSVSDAGFGELRRQLAYKCEWYGSALIVVDRFFPSTQLCSGCGKLNERVKGYEGLKLRRSDCDACGLSLDRDENAAINLRQAGLDELGIDPLPEGLREVTPVREEGSGLPHTREVKPTSGKQEASGRRATGRGGARRSTRKLAEVMAERGINRPIAKLHPRA